jgi:hypothetical protein
MNLSTFGFIFTAKKFLEAARIVVAHETEQEGEWHPVGKYLSCHSFDLSFKAFLTLRGKGKRTSDIALPNCLPRHGSKFARACEANWPRN